MEFYWQLKIREQRLEEGGKNTKFFNALTKQLDSIYLWIDKEEDIEQVVVGYFDNLFHSSISRDLSPVVREIPTMVTLGMNEALACEVIEKEVKRVLFSLNPGKASGPDGMTTQFFQKFWAVISHDLITMVKIFLDQDCLMGRLMRRAFALFQKGINLERCWFTPY